MSQLLDRVSARVRGLDVPSREDARQAVAGAAAVKAIAEIDSGISVGAFTQAARDTAEDLRRRPVEVYERAGQRLAENDEYQRARIILARVAAALEPIGVGAETIASGYLNAVSSAESALEENYEQMEHHREQAEYHAEQADHHENMATIAGGVLVGLLAIPTVGVMTVITYAVNSAERGPVNDSGSYTPPGLERDVARWNFVGDFSWGGT